jgi:hypothetical protein
MCHSGQHALTDLLGGQVQVVSASMASSIGLSGILCLATRRAPGPGSAHRRPRRPRSSTSSTRRSMRLSPIIQVCRSSRRMLPASGSSFFLRGAQRMRIPPAEAKKPPVVRRHCEDALASYLREASPRRQSAAGTVNDRSMRYDAVEDLPPGQLAGLDFGRCATFVAWRQRLARLHCRQRPLS